MLALVHVVPASTVHTAPLGSGPVPYSSLLATLYVAPGVPPGRVTLSLIASTSGIAELDTELFAALTPIRFASGIR